VYWPAEPGLQQGAVTKRDLLRYLVTAAPFLLPHVVDRPLTLFRWPTGIHGRRVLQKHGEIALPPFVERTQIFSDAKGHPDQYLLCNNLATLLWLAHMGVLEWHVWHSRVRPGDDATVKSVDFASSTSALQKSVIEYPDYILFDLDPFIYAGHETRAKEPELNARAFAQAVTIAESLEAALRAMSLRAYVKTSGKTGLHVVVPIRRSVTYQLARELARVIGEHLHQAHPREVTLSWSVDKRADKVFVDTNMNARGKSISAPYSPRALPGAPVSMPIGWKDLAGSYPLDFRVPGFLEQFPKHDPWAAVLTDKQAVEERLAGG